MIEDALKATRLIHRLIISVSLLTMVFAFSVKLPREKVEQVGALTKLLSFDFEGYDQFIEDKISEVLPDLVDANLKTFNEAIDGTMIFGLEEFSKAASQPIHVGKIRTEDLIFADVADATLAGFDSVSSALSVDRSVEIWVPRVDAISEEILEFFATNPQAGSRIGNVRFEFTLNFEEESSTPVETFLDGKEGWAQIYFELIQAGGPIATPVFVKDLPAEKHVISQTSWREWIKSQPEATTLYSGGDGEMKWLPAIEDRPDGFDQKKIGLLIAELKQDLKESSPEERSMTILGSEIPGILVVFAVPLVLCVLGYYLLNHLGHLSRVLKSGRDEYVLFAWMPLSLGKSWRIESVTTLLVLPILSIVILNLRLSVFGTNRLLVFFASLAATLLVGFLGYVAIQRLARLRLGLGMCN